MIPFTKMHGIGNDFVMVNNLNHILNGQDLPDLAVRMCNRHFGVGADGLILVEPSEIADYRMTVYNSDGTTTEMCGNGIRCFSLFLHELNLTEAQDIDIETGAGILKTHILPDRSVCVDMGKARLTRGEVGIVGDADDTFINHTIMGSFGEFKATGVSMGNPHIVLFTEDINSVPLEDWGPKLSTHPLFPNQTNVHFVQVINRQHIVQRTWERGAGATLACGTGASAAVVAGHLLNLIERSAKVELPGGTLFIEYKTNGHVDMTGPASIVFQGNWAG